MSMCFVGCTILSGPTPKDPTVLYHHNWWNYYRRGTNFLHNNAYALAEADFERALGLRPGATFPSRIDKWRILTYGMHVQKCYFPNRERGISQYYQGKTKQAIESLLVSLEQEESGRAKHYLNLARTRLLEEARVEPPVIELAAGLSTRLTALRTRKLEGRVTAEGRVADIRINGKRVFIELAEEDATFSQDIELREGMNDITVSITDLRGQTTTTNIAWLADWTAPQVGIKRVANAGAGWLVNATCDDGVGLERVSVNGQAVALSGGNDETGNSAALEHELARDSDLVIEATDLAGNTLRSVFTQADVARWLVSSGKRLEGDSVAPRLWGMPEGEVMTILNENFLLDLSSSDECGLARVEINRKDLLSDASRGSLQLAMRKRIPLSEGENTIEVSCQDLGGNVTTNSFVIVRKQPAHLDRVYRLAMGVTPTMQATVMLSEKVQNSLETEILRTPARFALLERGDTLDLVLREFAMGIPSICEPGSVLRIEKSLPTDLLVVSSYLTESQGATIYAQVIDLSNGRVVHTDDVYLPTDNADVNHMVGGLAVKIEQAFPLVQARITELAGRKARIDAGSRRGVRDGTRFLIIEVAEKADNMDTGRLMMSEVGPIEVRAVKPEESESRVKLPSPMNGEAKSSYYVYTR